MKKLLVCKFGTVFFGFLAVGVFSSFELALLPLYNGDLLAASSAVMSAIFGTQWIEYRKRRDTDPASLPNRVPSESSAV